MYPVLYESIERGTLLVIHNERKTLAGFVNYYIRKDGWHTIREIAVDKRFLGQGVGQYLFQNVPKPIRLKCTIDNERAIAFYEKQGMVLVGKEVGRKRELLVWVLT